MTIATQNVTVRTILGPQLTIADHSRPCIVCQRISEPYEKSFVEPLLTVLAYPEKIDATRGREDREYPTE